MTDVVVQVPIYGYYTFMPAFRSRVLTWLWGRVLRKAILPGAPMRLTIYGAREVLMHVGAMVCIRSEKVMASSVALPPNIEVLFIPCKTTEEAEALYRTEFNIVTREGKEEKHGTSYSRREDQRGAEAGNG